MITEEEALAHIIESVKPLPPRRVPSLRRGIDSRREDVFARLRSAGFR